MRDMVHQMPLSIWFNIKSDNLWGSILWDDVIFTSKILKEWEVRASELYGIKSWISPYRGSMGHVIPNWKRAFTIFILIQEHCSSILWGRRWILALLLSLEGAGLLGAFPMACLLLPFTTRPHGWLFISSTHCPWCSAFFLDRCSFLSYRGLNDIFSAKRKKKDIIN